MTIKLKPPQALKEYELNRQHYTQKRPTTIQ
jgi:hypothetical protein